LSSFSRIEPHASGEVELLRGCHRAASFTTLISTSRPCEAQYPLMNRSQSGGGCIGLVPCG
jgi:hypothetical protein